MLARMGARQFRDWQRYYELDPWGEDQKDLRAGVITAMTHNRHRSKKERARKPSDYFPRLQHKTREPRGRRPSSAEFRAWVQAIAGPMSKGAG